MEITEENYLDIIEARQQLVIDDLTGIKSRYHKILSFDPSDVYDRAAHRINPFSRHNSVCTHTLFPQKENKICSCCENELPKRRSRYCSDECEIFAYHVYAIIYGKSEIIKSILKQVYEFRCFKCQRTESDFAIVEARNGLWCTPIHLEHSLPVKHGGGACWLSNFNFMCKDCHKNKTNNDFGWKKK